MFEYIRRLFWSPFPMSIKGHWYCGEWYMYLSGLRDNGSHTGKTLNPDPQRVESPARDRVAFNPFRTGHAGSDVSGLIDGLIPAIRIGQEIGLYRQVGNAYCKGYNAPSRYDGASWDDGYHIDLRFVRSVSAGAETKHA